MTDEKKTTVVKKKTAAPAPAPATEAKTEIKAVKSVTKKTPVVDLITQEASAIEQLSKNKAFEAIENLINDTDFNLFKIGGVLAIIQDNGWFIDEGYESLKDFVEAKHGMKYRKAMYSIQIYKALVESGVKWEQVKSIGWSKLRMIADVITLDNVEEYVALASDMTQTQLYEYVKEQKKGTLDTGKTAETDSGVNTAVAAESKKLSTMTFKLHSDQKEVIVEALEQAKNDADTEFDAVALEALCLNYLNVGPAKPAKKEKTVVKGFTTLKEAMAAHTYEDVLTIFEELWPEVSLAVMTEEEEEGVPFEADTDYAEDIEEEI